MNLHEMNPEDVIQSSWIETYRKERDALYKQFVDFNTNLYLFEKIISFPFGLFVGTYTTFWQAASNAFLESCLLTIYRIAIDSQKGALTVQKFRRNILNNIRSEVFLEGFDIEAALTSKSFDRAVAGLQDRILKIRHNYLAHLNRKLNIESIPKREPVYLQELKTLLDTLDAQYQLLCFNHRHSLRLLDYYPDAIRAGEYQPDIDDILDFVAKKSALLNMPEEQPAVWPMFREKLSQPNIETLNQYRRKFGLPEV